MSTYKKIIAVEAVQWNQSGDHPDVRSFPTTLGYPCPKCNQEFQTHGIIKDMIVCPGNYIVEDVDESITVLTSEEFSKRYESI